MPFKAHFKTNLESTTPIVLSVYISVKTQQQSGEQLQAFVNLINESRDKISKLIIIDTTYLHRHYDFKYSNKSVKSEWLHANEKILRGLEIEYEVVSYATITKTSIYKENLKKIKTDYVEDFGFQSLVNDFAVEFAYKAYGKKEKSIKFILDECAAVLTNSIGYYTYPGKCPAPIEYAKEKYKHMLQSQVFIIYKVTGRALEPDVKIKDTYLSMPTLPLQSTCLSFFGQYVGYIADNLGFDTPQKQTKFLVEFSLFSERLKYSLSDEVKSEPLATNENNHPYGQRLN